MNRPRGLGVWAAVGAVVLLAGVVWLWPTPQRSEPNAERAAAESSDGPVPDLVVGAPDPGGDHHEEGWTRQPWRPVANGFARDFARPGPSPADWRRRVGRWVTDYLADQYRKTARHRIPVADLVSVTGPGQPSQAVTAVATYDTGLTLGLQLEVFPEEGWKVTRVFPLD